MMRWQVVGNVNVKPILPANMPIMDALAVLAESE
jgi:hypothetical protein